MTLHTHRIHRLHAIIGAATFSIVLAAAPAHADRITFDRDIPGLQPSGFMSADSRLVTFWNSVSRTDSQLIVENIEGNGTNALAYFGTGSLLMRFALPATFMSLSFGNDEPTDTRPGDVALLTLFLNNAVVRREAVVLNRDNVMNQTISAGTRMFDEATFVLADRGSLAPIPFLAELVDDVNFTPTPEPATVGLVAAGLAMALRARRGRRVERRV